MKPVQATKTDEQSSIADNTMDTLFDKLDEAIDDIENDDVDTIEEAWEQIDTI